MTVELVLHFHGCMDTGDQAQVIGLARPGEGTLTSELSAPSLQLVTKYVMWMPQWPSEQMKGGSVSASETESDSQKPKGLFSGSIKSSAP